MICDEGIGCGGGFVPSISPAIGPAGTVLVSSFDLPDCIVVVVCDVNPLDAPPE